MHVITDHGFKQSIQAIDRLKLRNHSFFQGIRVGPLFGRPRTIFSGGLLCESIPAKPDLSGGLFDLRLDSISDRRCQIRSTLGDDFLDDEIR